MFMLVLLVEHIFLTNFYGLYLFSLKSSRPCRGLNPGPPRHQADMLPTELSWLGWKRERERESVCFLETKGGECVKSETAKIVNAPKQN